MTQEHVHLVVAIMVPFVVPILGIALTRAVNRIITRKYKR